MRTCKECKTPKENSAFLNGCYTCKECQKELRLKKRKDEATKKMMATKRRLAGKPEPVQAQTKPVKEKKPRKPRTVVPRNEVVRYDVDICERRRKDVRPGWERKFLPLIKRRIEEKEREQRECASEAQI